MAEGTVNEITASKVINDVEKKATIAFDFGGTADKAIALFGAEVVYSNFVRSAVITAQAAMRRALEAGKSQEEVAGIMANWKPGVTLERVIDPVAALFARWDKMDDSQKTDILKKLKEKK